MPSAEAPPHTLQRMRTNCATELYREAPTNDTSVALEGRGTILRVFEPRRESVPVSQQPEVAYIG